LLIQLIVEIAESLLNGVKSPEQISGVNVKRIGLILVLSVALLVPLSAPARFSVASAFSQGQSATATKPVAGKPAVDINSRVLSNGLEIVTLEDHSVPLVTIELAVRNGSFTEPPELNGLSHLYEHMFFKANRAIANQEDYLQKIGQLGIAYNGQTREEVVDYYFTTTSPNLRTAMNFMRDAVRYPLFDKTEFEREQRIEPSLLLKSRNDQSVILQIPEQEKSAWQSSDGCDRDDRHDALDSVALLRSKQLGAHSYRRCELGRDLQDGPGILRRLA